jgi:hypothetical protein
MSDQLSIFDAMAAPAARQFDPPTSHEAAACAKELQARHHRIIAAALEQHGPCGKDRIAALTNLTGVQVARRTCEMHRAGKITLTGGYVRSTSGRREREWALT